MRDLKALEAAFYSRDYQVTDHLAKDAGIGPGRPGDHLTVTGINDEHDANELTIAGMNLQMIGELAVVGAQGDDDAFVSPGGAQGGML